MNMQMREWRSYVREFVEVPASFRLAVVDAIKTLTDVLDQLDAVPDHDADVRLLPQVHINEA